MILKSLLTTRTGVLASSFAVLVCAVQAQTVYVENFDTAPSSVGGAFSVSIGGDADGAGVNNKEVTMGQWGLTANGSLASGTLQPQITGAINARLAGVFLDSTVMNAGAGTYTLEFDVVGDPAAGASDSAAVYVAQGSGYDASNFLVLDLAEAGLVFEPLSATGTAVASQLAGLSIADTTVSETGVQLTFIYDGTTTIAIAFGAFDSGVAFDNLSIYKSATYSTDFEGFTINTDFVKDFSVALGSSDLGLPVANTKFAESTQWGITSNGNDFTAGLLRPQANPANNVKMAGLFLDPALFSGAGQYTITFDITGDPQGNESYRAYVFAGSGYDFDDTGDDYLSLSLSGNGFVSYTGLTAVGAATASELLMQDLSAFAVEPATNSVSITFTYDGSSAIAFAVGGFNNAALIDNFSIAPYEAPAYTVYGTGFEAFVGGTNAINEFQAGVGEFVYGGPTPFPAGTKVLKHLNPQWGAPDAAAFTTGNYLRPQTNATENVKLACIYLAPEYFKMGSGTYTISFDLSGDPVGNAAYRAYVWNGSGTAGSTADYLKFDVSADGFAGLTGLTAAGAATAAPSPLVEKDISFQSKLSGTVQVAIDFTYTAGDTICFAVGGFKNSATIDNLKVTTTIAPPGTVMYATDFSSFNQASDAVPAGEYKQDFNIAYGSETDIMVVGTQLIGGDFLIDFTGFPSTTGLYQVLKSSDLASFGALTTPVFAGTDGSGFGTATVPATEMADPKQFFQITDLFNTRLVDSGQWGITGNGNAFADGIARPQKNPASNVKMAGIILDPAVFTAGAGTYTLSFEISGDTLGNAAYRAFAFAGSGYDLSGTTGERLSLSLSANGFAGYTGLTGPVASQIHPGVINGSTTLDNGTTLDNAAAISATRMVTFDFTWDGVSAIAIAIGGFNNASTIDNFFVNYVAP